MRCPRSDESEDGFNAFTFLSFREKRLAAGRGSRAAAFSSLQVMVRDAKLVSCCAGLEKHAATMAALTGSSDHLSLYQDA
jgi:hypothetical protein